MSDAPAVPMTVALVAVAAVGVAFLVWRKGGVAGAASSVGDAAVAAAGGFASGTVGAIGSSVGLPTPMQTTTDPRVARWLIDRAGWFEASKWSGGPALWDALNLPAGSGQAPPGGSALARAFPGASSAPGGPPPAWSTPPYMPTDPGVLVLSEEWGGYGVGL